MRQAIDSVWRTVSGSPGLAADARMVACLRDLDSAMFEPDGRCGPAQLPARCLGEITQRKPVLVLR